MTTFYPNRWILDALFIYISAGGRGMKIKHKYRVVTYSSAPLLMFIGQRIDLGGATKNYDHEYF